MAQDILLKLNIDADNSSKTINQLETDLEKLNNELKQVDRGSTEFKQLSNEVRKAQTELKKVELSLETLDFDQMASEVGGFAGGVTSAFAGLSAVIGESDEDFEKFTQSLLKGIVVAEGIRGAMEAAAAAQKLYNAAVAGSPLGLIVAIIGAAAGAYFVLADGTDEAAEAQKELNKIQREGILNLKQLELQITNLTGTLQEQRDLQIEINKLQTESDLANLASEYNLVGQNVDQYKTRIESVLSAQERLRNKEEEIKTLRGTARKEAERDAELIRGTIKNNSDVLEQSLDTDLANVLEYYLKRSNIVKTGRKNEELINEQYFSKLQAFREQQLNEIKKLEDKIRQVRLDRINDEISYSRELETVQTQLYIKTLNITNATIKARQEALNLQKRLDIERIEEAGRLQEQARKQAIKDNEEQVEDVKKTYKKLIAEEKFLSEIKKDFIAAGKKGEEAQAVYENMQELREKGKKLEEEYQEDIDNIRKKADKLQKEREHTYLIEKIDLEKTVLEEIKALNRTYADETLDIYDELNENRLEADISAVKRRFSREQDELVKQKELINAELLFLGGKEDAEEIKALKRQLMIIENLEKKRAEKLQKDITEITEQYIKQRTELIRQENESGIQRNLTLYQGYLLRESKLQEQQLDINKERELEAQEELLNEKIINEEQYQQNLANIDKFYENEKLKVRLDKIMEVTELGAELWQQYADARLEIALYAEDELLNARLNSIEQEKAAVEEALSDGLISREQAENEQQRLDEARDKADLENRVEKAKLEKRASTTEAIIATALGVAREFATKGIPAAFATAPIVAAQGAAQIAAIQATPLPTFQRGGILSGPSHNDGGIPILANGGAIAEAEGGEVILTNGVTSNPLLTQFASLLNVASGGQDFANASALVGASNGLTADMIASVVTKSIEAIPVINVATDTDKKVKKVNNVIQKAKLK